MGAQGRPRRTTWSVFVAGLLAVALWSSSVSAQDAGADADARQNGVDGGALAADAATGSQDDAGVAEAADAAAAHPVEADAAAPTAEADGGVVQIPSAGASTLEAELARAEQVRRDQRSLRDALRERAKGSATEERRARISALAREVREVAPESEAADRLLPRIMDELRALQPEIDAALQDATAPSVPRYVPLDGAAAVQGEPPDPTSEHLAELRRSIDADADTLEAEARRLASDRLTESIRAEDELAATRVLLFERLRPEAREEALGVTRDGVEQLRWEIHRVGAQARWYWSRRDSTRETLGAAQNDPFLIGTVVARGAYVLAALVAVALVSRRRQRIADAAWPLVLRAVRRPRLLRGLEHARSALLALTPSLLFVAGVWGAHRALGPAITSVREVDLVYSLLLWYALYRLALAAGQRWIGGPPSAPEGTATGIKILRSLRTIGRYALGLAIVLALSEIVSGRGYIFHGVDRVAWLGWIAVGWILLVRWRSDICNAYLVRHDAGMLADAVRKGRSRWYGFFAAMLAFTVLVVSMGTRATGRFVLSFEQSHRVLAFIFRKRLERRGDAAASVVAITDLPEDLRRHLSEEPHVDPADEVDHFPGLDQFEASIAEWKDTHRIGALLLVGGAGSGKTTWLSAAERKVEGVPVLRIALRRRLLTAVDVITTIADAVDAPTRARDDVDALASWLRSQPRRVLVLDDLEHLFLRGLDTWPAWEAFLEIVEDSAPAVFWLCALAQHPYKFLLFAQGGAGVFRVIVQLEPWSEKKLTELLHARVRASGYKVSFDDLVVDDGGADHTERAAATEREFMRLLWDYSQGAPRVALHFWLRSMVPAGENTLHVRLFRAPVEDHLEALNEQERFVLASVVWHDSLTTEEAAISLGYPRLSSRDALAKLIEMGVIDDLGGRHRVTMRWQRAVTNFLLRKHLIQS